MNRTKIQRLTALLLCLIFVTSCFSVNVIAADGTDGSAGETENNEGGYSNSSLTFDAEEMLELLSAISYREYISEYASVASAESTIYVDAVKDVVADKCEFDVAENIGVYDGVEALLTPGTGDASWKVNVPKTAKYTVKLICYPVDDRKVNSVERVFKINGKVPFSEARYLTIKKNWVNDYSDAIYTGKEDLSVLTKKADDLGLSWYKNDAGKLCFEYPGVWTSGIASFCDEYGIRFMKLDINNNEIRPTADQVPEWTEYLLDDSTGYYTEAFEFVLEKGENIITLEGKNAPMAISAIILSPIERIDTYEETCKICG